AVEEDVAGLDVAVDDALAVSVVEGLGGLAGGAEDLAEAQPGPSRVEAGGEVRALHEFEGEIEEALGLAGVEQGDDVGMEEAAGCPGLAQQTVLAVVDLLGSRDETDGLDGQLAIDLGVLGEVHLPHGPGAQELDDAVAA